MLGKVRSTSSADCQAKPSRSSVPPKIGGLTALILILFLLLATACGGPGFEPPTAIPADVVVPVQPTPVYADDVVRFTVETPVPYRAETDLQTAGQSSRTSVAARPTVVLVYEQTPSALGVIRGGAVLRSAPDGDRIRSFAAGTTVTITGKSADGSTYAIFDHDGVAGWIAATSVIVFGGDDLTVVEEAAGPGPIATLIAEAMQPMEASVLEGVGQE